MKVQNERKEAILQEVLELVPFEGWVPSILEKSAKNAGYEPGYAHILFPGGITDLVTFFIEWCDKEMLRALGQLPLQEMKVRERIATAVKTRILQHNQHRNTIQPTLRFFAQPQHAWLGSKLLGHTCSEIWYVAGDRSSDFNYYTKRFLLAGVYSSTLLYWLDDNSEGFERTWAFLDRRIQDALTLGSMNQKIKQLFGKGKKTAA